VADERTLAEVGRLADRNEEDIKAIRGDYLLRAVYDADERGREARFRRLEDTDNSQAAGRHSWVIGIGLAAVGAVLGFVSQILTARGHG
jgi:hypothetical protein